MATFEQLFPTFLQKCAELHELLRIVAFMLFIVGTILQLFPDPSLHAPAQVSSTFRNLHFESASLGRLLALIPRASVSPLSPPQTKPGR
jgi:hypothetical protein